MDITLKNVLEQGWRQVLAGAEQSSHPFRNCTIAHAADTGTAVYTVVLRDASPEQQELAFYTDVRSEKIVQLQADERISVLFYDKEEQLQYVITGKASIDSGNDSSLMHWQKAGYKGRTSYLAVPPPSTPVDNAITGLEYLEGTDFKDDDTAGYEHFAVVNIHVQAFEYLKLNRTEGNRRARFMKTDGEWVGTWIIP